MFPHRTDVNDAFSLNINSTWDSTYKICYHVPRYLVYKCWPKHGRHFCFDRWRFIRVFVEVQVPLPFNVIFVPFFFCECMWVFLKCQKVGFEWVYLIGFCFIMEFLSLFQLEFVSFLLSNDCMLKGVEIYREWVFSGKFLLGENGLVF